MIVRAPYLERVRAGEPEDDSILVVHPDGMLAPPIAGERVQVIPWGHVQVFEPGYGVDLVELSPNDWPQLAWDAACRFCVDAQCIVLRGDIAYDMIYE